MKDSRSLILGEALGDDPTDPYPVGNETFIQNHLRDVAAAVAPLPCSQTNSRVTTHAPKWPIITADQLQVAHLLVTAGRLGLPHLQTFTLVARIACLATCAQQFSEDLVRQERPQLLERLRDLSEHPPAQMAGDLLEAPAGLSLLHLSRELTRSNQSKAVSDL